jgi:hypothetical protein
VILTGFDRAKQVFDAISWGTVMPMSYAWYERYAGTAAQGEAYGVLSHDWTSPEGFDFAALQLDLSEITGTAPHPPVPAPPPSPTPPPKPTPPAPSFGCVGPLQHVVAKLVGFPE